LLRVGELERAEEEARGVEFDGCRMGMRGKQFSSGLAACVRCFYFLDEEAGVPEHFTPVSVSAQ
jgi:hypothetical protein